MKPIKIQVKRIIQDKKALRRAVMVSMILQNPYASNVIAKDRRADSFLPPKEEDRA